MVTNKRHIIRTLSLLLLLLLAGVANDAWAKKVTYHILTKPFNVRNYDDTDDYRKNIRVEALQCTSDESKVGLPDQFKSPLAKNFRYWKSAKSRKYDFLYDYNHSGTKIIATKFYIYECEAANAYACVENEITDFEGTSTDDAGFPNDIYVTYEYINDRESVGYKNGKIELDGVTNYNVSITNSKVKKFLCYNRSRNNRIANANDAALSGEHLASDDFVIPEEGTEANQLSFNYGKWGPIGVFLGFKFKGEDPYNITIMTSYAGKELHITDAITNVDNTGTIKPYAESTLMCKVGATSMWFDASYDRHYKLPSGIKDAGKWTEAKYQECKDTYYNPDNANNRYDTWVGFYRYESPTLNTYALLPHPNKVEGSYLFVGSKMNQGDKNSTTPTISQPNSSGQYYTYYDAYDNNETGANGKKRSQPYFKLQTLSNAYPTQFYEIKPYTVHVTTQGGTELTATMKWSDARLSDNPAEHFPEVLKRKYCNYTAYKDAELTKPVTTFQEILDADNGRNIYLKYTVSESMPFETLPTGGNYQDARWYTMRMDGVANPKNIAYNDGSNNLVVTNTPKGSNNASEVHTGENSAEAMVAFMGDPYELKILNRAACEAAPVGNKFIGCASASGDGTGLSTNITSSSDISKWEIVYESTSVAGMMLRQFNTASSTPKYIGLGSAANKPVTYSGTESRIRVVELEKVKYYYHIVRNDAGDIAVKASDSHDVGKKLKSWTDIPEIIRSPFLSSATVTFYGSIADAKAKTNAISNAPYESNRDIYVRYSVSLSGDTYNIRLNNEYIYTGDGDVIYNKPLLDPGDEENEADNENGAFRWTLDYSDPYHMTIWNEGKEAFVNVTFSDDESITWNNVTTSYFVAKSGAIAGTYEVMAATGDGTDASVTNYNLGRPSANTVKLYSNSSYNNGNAVLRFQLIGTNAKRVTYHLIDKKGKDLLQATTRQTNTDLTSFPPEYYSPLVRKYHYYIEDNFDYNSTTDTYTLKSPTPDEHATIGEYSKIYVTYDVNDLVDLKAGQLYLLEYEGGEEFYQEDGSDGRSTTKQKAIYPYVNGDGNFFVYGQEQYDIQQEGASSTRTRWAWYVESNVEGAPKGDPYHVMIKSRQTESYPITNSSEYNAYFMTYKPDGYDKVVTTLGWPGMNSETATEYMVLGSEGQYQLVTSYTIPIDLNGDGDTEDDGEDDRYVVNSFEQYWKTYDTIRRKLLKQPKNDTYPDKDDENILVQSTPCLVDGFDDNRTYLTTSTEETTPGLGFHSYEKWAYAKRWNGYNNGYSSTEGTHETKKGWERVEHWYQTVKMGQGYFKFVKTEINPVLILLDQHGWEIMRKPIPTSDGDPKKDTKLAAISPYNSPMVKEYAFWATAKKRTGFHQYYLLSDRIGGDNYTSTDLTILPEFNSKNVYDKKGNLNDQYVTYIVKDEYAQTYTPSTKNGEPFLIEQGSKYASTDGTTITKKEVSSVVDMKTHILNDDIPATEKWYVKPNANIDIEMGYNDAVHTWTTDPEEKTPNAYDATDYKFNKTAVYIDQTDAYKNAGDAAEQKKITDKYGLFSFSNGFDPYNIQIESVKAKSLEVSDRYIKTNANGATLEEGSLIGSYSSVPGTISIGDNATPFDDDDVEKPNKPKWYDSRKLDVTNATFMAVQDAVGNMQLMPRFDHTTRMSEFGTLIPPTDENVATTYTKLYRPEVYEYLIIDNDGNESLRYKTGGDMKPQTPDHFRSPLATNFKYYATATYDSEAKTYSDITDEIEESLDGVTLSENTLTHNKVVYVRYEYDDESDGMNMLKGNWLTMQLNEKDAIYNSGIKQASGEKPSTIDGGYKQWQWKFAETSQSTPDPYAIYIYNRSQSAGTKAMDDRFALLSHSEGDYALVKAGVGTYTYSFLNGGGMNTTIAASVAQEAGFTPTSSTLYGTSQVKLFNDVTHNFTYKVYTNAGVEAISADQSQEDVYSNDWKPVLPREARTPLLNMDQYLYYEQNTGGTLSNALSYLFGLYDDIVYTHYTPYNPNVSTYVVPNVRNATGTTVARGVGSNDAPVGLDGKRPYNIIWYQDNMMKSNNDGTAVASTANQELNANDENEWEFEGDDPYAIKIKSVGASNANDKYIHEATGGNTELSTTATTFMLLNKDGYDYGVFAKTGDATTMLSGWGNTLTASDPTHFIPFALSTFKVIYHLMIKNIGDKIGVVIPYRGSKTESVNDYRIKWGTTLRDLKTRNTTGGVENHIDGDLYQLGASLKSIQSETSGLFYRDSIYCYDAGHISLGDAFKIPQAFSRPNVSYDYYIEGVYSSDGKSEITAMNNEYKGLKMTNLGDDTGLLGNIVFVNVVYNFMGGLDTNSGSDFVESVDQNKWYTFETSDATPKLAEYSDVLKTVSGYATHYTNDYLWTPVGDPYGFKMYNRYLYKNLGRSMVMSTEDFDIDTPIKMVYDSDPYVPYQPANSVYELLTNSTTTPGYFRVHPVVNKSGTQVYIKNDNGTMKLSTTPTEWTFGLSEEVMRPYYQSAGYVGGLNADGKTAYEAALNVEGELAKLMALQDVVYNHDTNDENNYIVHYTPGYYRLHSQPGSSGITTPRYMSGYTHAIERDVNGDNNEADAIPLHFYEVEKYDVNNPTFKDLGTAGTDYTLTNATRGDIPLVTVDKDPASIFYFPDEEIDHDNDPGTATVPGSKIITQGLYVNENKMTATPGNATSYQIIDIGAGIVALQNGVNFLKYAQTNPKYDLKYDNTASTVESARWCMQPVQKGTSAGNGEMPLKVTTNNGGDEYYYTTFYAPFDVLLTNDKDVAYIVPTGDWPAMTAATKQYILHPKKIGEYNTAENGCPEDYRDKNYFIPANTPVIIRTKNTSGEVTMALPTTTPSKEVSCVFSGEYLEQMLAQNSSEYVFTFGRAYTHSGEFEYFPGTGVVTPAGLELDKGVGFYINANNDRESNATKTMWTRNNKYVYGNKIYYRGSIASSSRELTRGIEFIPVVFDDEELEDPDIEDANGGRVGDDSVYDLSGRMVATKAQVENGTWRHQLTPGIYIINGKKIIVK